ncbi:MAG: acyl-CoA dehydrogenase family protein, partial [Actinomycetota bacterium]
FGEVFFTDARTPTDMLVGSLNDGWRVAMTTLMFERGGNILGSAVRFQRMFGQLRKLAEETPHNGGKAIDDPVIRQELAKRLVEVELLRRNSERAMSPLLHGEPPGPESSMGKLYWSEWYVKATELAMEILGKDGLRMDSANQWLTEYLGARASTIYTGTSEIQRNILAERVLGLPRGGRN